MSYNPGLFPTALRKSLGRQVGITWTACGLKKAVTDIAYNGTVYVAVGIGNWAWAYKSSNGTSWTQIAGVTSTNTTGPSSACNNGYVG